MLILFHKTLQYNISEYPDEKRTGLNNVKILEKCALIVSWVRFEMGAGVGTGTGEGGFLCVIHTPRAKKQKPQFYSIRTEHLSRKMLWSKKTAKLFPLCLVEARKTERDRKGGKDIFPSLHHSLFWEACSPFCMINNIICTWPRLPAGCTPLCSRQGWVARAWCGTEASPSGVTRGLPNPRWACAGIWSNEKEAFMLISAQKQSIKGWWGC